MFKVTRREPEAWPPKKTEMVSMTPEMKADYLGAGDAAAVAYDAFVRAISLSDHPLVTKLLTNKLRESNWNSDERTIVKAYLAWVVGPRRFIV